MVYQRTCRFLKLSIICMVIAVAPFVLLPFSSFSEAAWQRLMAIGVASIFWVAMGLSQMFFWLANKGRKILEAKGTKTRSLVYPSIGLITFFSNIEARIFDYLLIGSGALFLVLLFLRTEAKWLTSLCMAALLLSFGMHCILNGKTYRYLRVLKHHKKRSQTT